jgi:hypothetical protein
VPPDGEEPLPSLHRPFENIATIASDGRGFSLVLKKARSDFAWISQLNQLLRSLLAAASNTGCKLAAARIFPKTDFSINR